MIISQMRAHYKYDHLTNESTLQVRPSH